MIEVHSEAIRPDTFSGTKRTATFLNKRAALLRIKILIETATYFCQIPMHQSCPCENKDSYKTWYLLLYSFFVLYPFPNRSNFLR